MAQASFSGLACTRDAELLRGFSALIHQYSGTEVAILLERSDHGPCREPMGAADSVQHFLLEIDSTAG